MKFLFFILLLLVACTRESDEAMPRIPSNQDSSSPDVLNDAPDLGHERIYEPQTVTLSRYHSPQVQTEITVFQSIADIREAFEEAVEHRESVEGMIFGLKDKLYVFVGFVRLEEGAGPCWYVERKGYIITEWIEQGITCPMLRRWNSDARNVGDYVFAIRAR